MTAPASPTSAEPRPQPSMKTRFRLIPTRATAPAPSRGAMSEVHYIHQTEDEREAHSNKRVHQPSQQAAQQALQDRLRCHDAFCLGLPGVDGFIGQIGSAMAACKGKIVTNLPLMYCRSTGSASLFCPVSSNFTCFQGMMVRSPGRSVAPSA